MQAVVAVLGSALLGPHGGADRQQRCIRRTNGRDVRPYGYRPSRLRLRRAKLRAQRAGAIDAILNADPLTISHIAMVHSGTTTGMLNPIDEVGALGASLAAKPTSLTPEQLRRHPHGYCSKYYTSTISDQLRQ